MSSFYLKDQSSKENSPDDGMLVIFCLDATGSMDVIKDETISSFNSYLRTLSSESDGGDIFFSLIQFNSFDTVRLVDAVPISDVMELDEEVYVPRGFTPLYDAVAFAIGYGEARRRNLGLSRVLCVVLTDGKENFSTEYTLEAVRSLISQKIERGWRFVYLGADQDAWEVGQSMGVPVGNSITFTASKQGIATAMSAVAIGTRSLLSDPDVWTADSSVWGGVKTVEEFLGTYQDADST